MIYLTEFIDKSITLSNVLEGPRVVTIEPVHGFHSIKKTSLNEAILGTIKALDGWEQKNKISSIHKKLNEHYGEISDSHREYISFSGSTPLNKALIRYHKNPETETHPFDKEEFRWAKELDVTKPTPMDLTLYSGLGFNPDRFAKMSPDSEKGSI